MNFANVFPENCNCNYSGYEQSGFYHQQHTTALNLSDLQRPQSFNENCIRQNHIHNLCHIEDDKNDKNINNISINCINKINHNANEKETPQFKRSTPQKFKENYLDLLIESADELIKSGLNINELKEMKLPKNSTHNINHHQKQNVGSFFSKKCENKICPVVVTKRSNIFQAKISSLKNKILWLCSQCYQAWKNGQYCYYCGVIYRHYRGTKGFNDTKSWIACDYCNNWEHIQCEEKKGKHANLSQVIKKDKHFKYKCPICRSKSGNESVSSRKHSLNKEDSHERGNYLQMKRKSDFVDPNKRKIKKRKEFDEINTNSHSSNSSQNINIEKNDISDDIEKILSLGSNLHN